MNEVKDLIDKIILNNEIIYGVISNLRKKSEDSFTKVTIKPVLIKDNLKLQITYEYKNKVIHKNLEANESIIEIEKLLTEDFKQAVLFTKQADYQILISKKGKANILKKKPTKEEVDISHNRKKLI